MKLSLTLTLDGLVRTLRRVAHDLADEADHGYLRHDERDAPRFPAAAQAPTRMNDDDRTGR
jgi:hypothetical protein